jgi:hypothetical protein
MPTGVELKVQEQIDNLAAWRDALLAASNGRTPLRGFVDDAADFPYEDRIVGATITALDASLRVQAPSSVISPWVVLHNSYYQLDAGISGVTTLAQAIAHYRWRVPERFNELFFGATGNYLGLNNVFPRASLIYGTIAHGGSYTPTTDVFNTSRTSPGKVRAQATANVGASNWTLTATLTRGDATTVNLAVTFTASDPSGTKKTFGQQALSSNAASGQAVLAVGATSQFKVGELVLVEDDDDQEIGTVESITLNTSITLSANLRHAYATADNAKVTPLFRGVTACTQSGSSSGNAAQIRVDPDREVSL